MSYYPNFLAPPAQGIATWVFQVNPKGEVIAYQVDGSGKAGCFAAGKVAEVLESVFNTPDSTVWVSDLARWNGQHKLLPSVACLFGWKVHRWRDLAATLNGKSSVRRAHARGVLETLSEFEFSIRDYVFYHEHGYRVGEKGAAWDAEQDAQAQAEKGEA